MSARLFVYSTLRSGAVQAGVIGRVVPMEQALLLGYAEVVTSVGDTGEGVSITLIPDAPDTMMPGVVLTLGESDLPAIDAYQGAAYRRVEAQLDTRETVWVHIQA